MGGTETGWRLDRVYRLCTGHRIPGKTHSKFSLRPQESTRGTRAPVHRSLTGIDHGEMEKRRRHHQGHTAHATNSRATFTPSLQDTGVLCSFKWSVRRLSVAPPAQPGQFYQFAVKIRWMVSGGT